MRVSDQLASILKDVEKPARYTGGEVNMVVKDPKDVAIRFAFAFPDIYEVGMSHLGSRILYDILNRRRDTYCERVFAPWVDMQAAMEKAHMPLFTLETGTELSQFDFVGFTLQYELSYTNVLNMLRLSGLPLRAKARAGGPIIAAGGPCAFNPEPLAEFIDLFMIGDGEEVIGELMDLYQEHGHLPKERFLLMAAQQIQGIYVPRFYEPAYHDDGTLERTRPVADVPPRVKKRMVPDLENAPYPEAPIVPYLSIVHDRIMLEVFRGCTRGCRFCQAGMIYRPVREKSPDKVAELAEKLMENTGYEEMSLFSLSTGDYSHLGEVNRRLNDAFADKRVSLSLPSQRIDSFARDMAREASRVRKSGLTFAPEAGSQRLRDVINKNVTKEDLLRAVRFAFENGWNSIKLYFMIGLPTETTEDIEALAKLVHAVCDAYYAVPKAQRAPGLTVNVSTSTFVPKSHTPFQWCAQDGIETTREKQALLKELLRRRGVRYKWHDARVSRIEAAFALGDRRLADVLEKALEKGCRFDGWDEYFSYDRWLEAFSEAGVDIAFFANREREPEEALPWDHIDSGVTKAFLKAQWLLAKAAKTTPDCRESCHGCGLAAFGGCP
ncbi:MAG: TIGR03960 family B12-binding radical SAM protein [Christensenellales bacterium]|jgi:radical SAM family uncharacterized protein